jgi:hypothetical protein
MNKNLISIQSSLILLVLASCDGFTLPSFNFSGQSSNLTGSSMTTGTSDALNTSFQYQPTSLDIFTPPSVPTNLVLPQGVCEPNSTPRVSLNTAEEYDLFFHPTTKVMIDFYLTKENLLLINRYGNNVVDHDRYVNASIRIDVTPSQGTVLSYCYPTVGLRMKGNFSRQDFVNENGVITNFVNLKVSFSTDNLLDGRVPNQQFLGMTRLDLKWNRNFDHTHVRQVFNHKLFHDYIPYVSQATLGGVRIIQTGVSEDHRNNYLGMYTIVEPMDRRFLVRRFGPGEEANGNLYKVLFSQTGAADLTKINAVNSDGTNHLKTGNKIGVENNPANYHPSYDLKTNTQLADFKDIVNLIGELNSSSNVNNATYRARVEAVIDMPSFLMMEAIAYLIGNPDDYRNNYNNMYIYFRPSDGKAYFIPFDLDRGFGSNGDYDPTHNQYSQFGPSLTKVTPLQDALLKANNNGRLNPLHQLTVFQNAYLGYQQMYLANIASLINTEWFTSINTNPGQYQGKFYDLHQAYRVTYYPGSNDLTYVRPTAPALTNVFVPFSINQTTMLNITFHSYITAKLSTYTASIS